MPKKDEEVKKSAKEKRQEKARLKAGAVASKKKDVEVDEVGEAVDAAAKQLKELNAGSTSKSVADQALAAARNVTGELRAITFKCATVCSRNFPADSQRVQNLLLTPLRAKMRTRFAVAACVACNYGGGGRPRLCLLLTFGNLLSRCFGIEPAVARFEDPFFLTVSAWKTID